MVLQLGNLYLLLAIIGVAVLYSSSEPRVIRNYIIALGLGDIGHLLATYRVLGHSRYMDVMKWNAMAFGNIGITVSVYNNNTHLGNYSSQHSVVKDIPLSLPFSISAWILCADPQFRSIK